MAGAMKPLEIETKMSPSEVTEGGALLALERSYLGFIVRNPYRVRSHIKSYIKSRDFVDPLHRRLFQSILVLVRANGAKSKVHPEIFMKEDNLLKKLGGRSFLMKIANDAAHPDEIEHCLRKIALSSKSRREVIKRNAKIINIDNDMERKLHIKRLAKLDACTLIEVIESSPGKVNTLDTLSEQNLWSDGQILHGEP